MQQFSNCDLAHERRYPKEYVKMIYAIFVGTFYIWWVELYISKSWPSIWPGKDQMSWVSLAITFSYPYQFSPTGDALCSKSSPHSSYRKWVWERSFPMPNSTDISLPIGGPIYPYPYPYTYRSSPLPSTYRSSSLPSTREWAPQLYNCDALYFDSRFKTSMLAFSSHLHF